MTPLDYAVLFSSILAIALYGILRTRGRRNLHDYLRGKKQSAIAIGLSVMATQASAVTFLSTPGQAYSKGMGFIQNYFAIPIALVIIAAFFLPIYRKLNVYTSYEYLGTRFDKKTRLLAAILFLIQRGLGAGITIYAPAIVLSTVFGWNLALTIVASGLVVIAYTVAGGSDAVTHTQKYQIAIIFVGMITAFIILLQKIPCSFSDALALAGHFGKTNAIDLDPSPKKDYTLWTGMFGGIFLMLSYFGTDQSQVQRYISGDHLRESRLGLMFNALFKIPMQFGILLLGIMLFVFYQFNPTPIFFNKTVLAAHEKSDFVWADPPSNGQDGSYGPGIEGNVLAAYEDISKGNDRNRPALIQQWLDAKRAGDPAIEKESLDVLDANAKKTTEIHKATVEWLKRSEPSLNTNDNDYVFITFILDNLPHGLIGLLVACFFFAALNSKAAELNALASTTTVDFYRYLRSPPRPTAQTNTLSSADPALDNQQSPIENQKSKIENPQDRHYVLSSKLFTALWGAFAIGAALVANLSHNLIEASNILGSIFSGVVLGLFLIAFFIKFIQGTATFYGAILAQSLVIVLWTLDKIYGDPLAYLWFNLIGAAACIAIATILQLILGTRPEDQQGFPVLQPNPTQTP